MSFTGKQLDKSQTIGGYPKAQPKPSSCISMFTADEVVDILYRTARQFCTLVDQRRAEKKRQ